MSELWGRVQDGDPDAALLAQIARVASTVEMLEMPAGGSGDEGGGMKADEFTPHAGVDLFGGAIHNRHNSMLGATFLIPPFSVLNVREGLGMGIRGEIGHGGSDALPGGGGKNSNYRLASQKIAENRADALGVVVGASGNETSIFDPVICELVYRWFVGRDGLVLDPFAGGSVRGVVASKMARRYVGVDLRAEQIEANRAQAQALCNGNQPIWHEGDSRKIVPCLKIAADFISGPNSHPRQLALGRTLIGNAGPPTLPTWPVERCGR